ncbi:MAG: 50S ribosomal protein L3 N(5)-glutamine methyltransferase [Thalassotalea sp.]
MSTFDNNSINQQLFTVADFVRFAASQFNQAQLYFGHGTDNAWDEAVVLVMFAVSLPTSLFEQSQQCRLTDEEKAAVLNIISVRISEELPAPYITNQADFAGLPFYVDDRVLVPRSPIGEYIEKRFAPFIDENNPPTRILDLCTGSGCIAIACGYYFPEADVDALDLSIDALNVAQMNIENHGMLAQVFPMQSDVFSAVENEKYDIIVTNPPYVDQEDVDSLPQEYLHEPEMGLGSGSDGLDITRKILAQSATHLNDNGILICEVGNSQIHVESQYPEVPFKWLTFERGGHGVFLLTKAQLEQYQEIFNQRIGA